MVDNPGPRTTYDVSVFASGSWKKVRAVVHSVGTPGLTRDGNGAGRENGDGDGDISQSGGRGQREN